MFRDQHRPGASSGMMENVHPHRISEGSFDVLALERTIASFKSTSSPTTTSTAGATFSGIAPRYLHTTRHAPSFSDLQRNGAGFPVIGVVWRCHQKMSPVVICIQDSLNTRLELIQARDQGRGEHHHLGRKGEDLRASLDWKLTSRPPLSLGILTQNPLRVDWYLPC